ncbi:MAG: M56 family metallopeptidase, partial [Pseudomonadota bacterium]
MSAFLFDTLIWTAVLIALVLVLRRPVTRWFGAPTAYALWALPMMRLLLPPIELPAWLAPNEALPQSVEANGNPIVIEAGSQAPAAVPLAQPVKAASVDLFDWLWALPLTEIALAAWLGGATVFLYLRFAAYFRLRRELTEGAREVGTTKGPMGTIRLIETPGTSAPLAFGVLTPVIALPEGFMARVDREARDLALEHELEHHRGHDLLINVLVQPLFALHWFNPLGRYGWLALRRDQEAACDARVIAATSNETRALYASVIASFAAGPNIALAAPMACPVLGDKSIIQRLRNLKMTEQSSHTKSRKLASRLMLGTAVLALPLTASITYAESLAPEPHAPPAVSVAQPAAPAA